MEISNQACNKSSREPSLIVMLTPDRKIDRRILLEADSLEAGGWRVVIIGMPLDPGNLDTDRRVLRVSGGDASVSVGNFVLLANHWFRRRLPINGRLIRAAKAFAWRCLIDQELFFRRLFSNAVSSFCPAIVVAHDLPMLPIAVSVSLRCGAKLVYDSHELYCEQEFSRRERRRWTEIESKYIGNCDAVITINPSIAGELEKRYGIRDVKVLYNAERAGDPPINRRLFHKVYGLSPETKVVLFQGGLIAGRNLDVLVRAMKSVRNPLVDLVVMGEGNLGSSLKKTADRLGLSGRVHFHPGVPQEDLLAFSACADAGVIPYQPNCLNNYYCTPNKLFEFIAAGVPILASDLPEIRNFLIPNRIGLVGDMSTPDTAACVIDDFFSDPGRLQGWKDQIMQVRQGIYWEDGKIVEIFASLPDSNRQSSSRGTALE
jgi:glycosyltransferase involved in cell wall biosynthesis